MFTNSHLQNRVIQHDSDSPGPLPTITGAPAHNARTPTYYHWRPCTQCAQGTFEDIGSRPNGVRLKKPLSTQQGTFEDLAPWGYLLALDTIGYVGLITQSGTSALPFVEQRIGLTVARGAASSLDLVDPVLTVERQLRHHLQQLLVRVALDHYFPYRSPIAK